MSSLSSYLAIYYLLLTFVISLALHPPQIPDGSITLTKPSLLSESLNASAGLENSNTAPILTLAKIDCDDRRFGNPPAASCKDALAQIPQDPATIITDPERSYGPRGKGSWDVNLPKRYVGCKHLLMPGHDSVPLVGFLSFG